MVGIVPQGYFKGLPYNISDPSEYQKRANPLINSILQGKMNVTLAITLNASATTTIIKDARIGFYSAIIPAMATTAHGAAAIAAGIWVNNIITGQATINHASSANADQSILLVILG